MDKTKIGQSVKFCPIFDATLVHDFMSYTVAEANPRHLAVQDTYFVDDALEEPLQHHRVERFAYDVVTWVELTRQHLCHNDIAKGVNTGTVVNTVTNATLVRGYFLFHFHERGRSRQHKGKV